MGTGRAIRSDMKPYADDTRARNHAPNTLLARLGRRRGAENCMAALRHSTRQPRRHQAPQLPDAAVPHCNPHRRLRLVHCAAEMRGDSLGGFTRTLR